ncbi:hypothetical protein [Paractinoplanes atraurantiacus]|nr:hypothetical protein [Actinoplanes atraurantiacus]
MDSLNARRPDGAASWVEYESRSQAELGALVPNEPTGESIQALRAESGAQGLACWSAMRPRPRP